MAGRRFDQEEERGRVKRLKTEDMDNKHFKNEEDDDVDDDDDEGGVSLYPDDAKVTSKSIINDLKKDRKC